MAVAGGSRGPRPLRRGHTATTSPNATSATSRATLSQRILRHTPSGPIAAASAARGAFAPCYLPPPPSNAGELLMASPEPLYDLVLLLDTSAPEDQRKKVLADTEAAISSAGSIVSDHDWGTRALAYEIRHRTDAEYHLLQFHGPATLLANLQRSLRIADGVLRFRIVKLAPGTPAPTELPRAEAPAAAPAPAAERPPAPAPEAAEAEAEAPSAA
jgi:small subunit ribosomal protein S6